jgi:hypothetical protein
MTKDEFLELMRFPHEWKTLNMYPDELFTWQVSNYEPGHEDASEHDRNGAFHWWLRQNPTEAQLMNLLKLAAADPDSYLGNDVRGYILKRGGASKNLDIQLQFDDQQAHVTVSAVFRISAGSIGFCLFSPEGGDCEVFMSAKAAREMANALKNTADFLEKGSDSSTPNLRETSRLSFGGHRGPSW